MVTQHKTLIFGAMLSACALTLSGVSMAGAGAFQPAPYIVNGAIDTNEGLVQVADKGRHMERNRDRDGDRCQQRRGDCRHFYRGYYYSTPWWTVPLIVGGGYGGRDDYDDEYDLSSQHVEWCLDHYRSYNPRTNTWVSYSGAVHQCESPYA